MKRGHSGSEDGDRADLSRLAKRLKFFESQSGEKTTHGKDEYDVAWVCALHIEMGAARAMLDETHDPLPSMENDTNSYVLGRIQAHNVVIACLPNAEYGTNSRGKQPEAHISQHQIWLMVGVGGADPSRQDILLGDVIVATRVMQYDYGKIVKGEFKNHSNTEIA
ncbi:hypothetical protein V2G26_005300 [Clonostachys chloroleuca]